MPLLQNQAGLHPWAIRHRRFHLPRHLGHQAGQASRSQLGPQPAARLVRQDHSRAYVLVRDMQQEVRALVEPASGPSKPKHTPATCPQLPRRIRLDTETASQVGAAAQQGHRTIHLLLGLSSRPEPWELFSWSHVTFARNPYLGDPARYIGNGPSRKSVPRTQLVAGGLIQGHSAPVSGTSPPLLPRGCTTVTGAGRRHSETAVSPRQHGDP